MTRPSCVPSSALLPRRGLPLSGNPGDLHPGVALAVAHPPPVAGLVLVMNDVDLGAGYRPHDLSGDLVVAKLVRVADDLAIIDHENGRKRHAGPDLTSEGVDGQDVVHRRLLLPATAAHDRVHRRTLSLLVRAHRAVPAPSGPRTRRGARQPCTGTLATQPWIRPVRWVFRLSDPGGRRCLRRRLPRLRGHVRWTRLPGGGPTPTPSAERLRRPGIRRLARAVAGHLRRTLARRTLARRTLARRALA